MTPQEVRFWVTSQDPSRTGREGSKSEASLCVPLGTLGYQRREEDQGWACGQVGGEAQAIPPLGGVSWPVGQEGTRPLRGKGGHLSWDTLGRAGHRLKEPREGGACIHWF